MLLPHWCRAWAWLTRKYPTRKYCSVPHLMFEAQKVAIREREAGFAVRGENGKVAEKIEEVLDVSDLELIHLGKLETRGGR